MKKISKHWFINDGINMSAVLGLCFFLNCFFIIAMKKFGIGQTWLFNKNVADDLPYSCIFAPITEEFIFRWLPLGFWNLSLGYILPTVGYFNDSSNSWF